MKVMIANRSLSLYLIGNPFIFKIIFSFTDRQEIRVVIPVFLWAFQHVAIIPFLINWWPFNMLEAKERQHDSYFSRRSWTGEICLKMWSNVRTWGPSRSLHFQTRDFPIPPAEALDKISLESTLEISLPFLFNVFFGGLKRRF